MTEVIAEKESKTDGSFTMERLTSREDMVAANDMRARSWLETYPNPAAGVSYEWVRERVVHHFNDPERVDARLSTLDNPRFAAWVARDRQGRVIGATSPYADEDGVQHVGSLYVDQAWHGKGVGGQLMQKVIEFFDASKPIQLGVVAYNVRAIAFYKKWGFEIVQGSDMLHDGVIPEITRVRQPHKVREQVATEML